MTWWYVLMGVGMVVLWGGIIVLAVALRNLYGDDRAWSAATRHPAPGEILAERFARGEITEQEYQHRMVILVGSPAVRDGQPEGAVPSGPGTPAAGTRRGPRA